MTKGRTFHELDILFAKNVSARKFATTNVDAFDESEANQLAARYSAVGVPGGRPSLAPSVTDKLTSHGKVPDTLVPRRASLSVDGGSR
jgi:hypothetical protein